MNSKSFERKVAKEASRLLRAVKKKLPRCEIEDSVRERIQQAASQLSKDLQTGDSSQLRKRLSRLDALSEKYIPGVRKSESRQLWEALLIALLFAVCVRSCLIEPFKIPSSSMLPTLQIGDFIFVDKSVHGLRIPYTTKKFFARRQPKKGDVVVFINPCFPDKDYIKRVIGTAGDTVEVRCNRLYVNGNPLQRELLEGEDTCIVEDEYGEQPCLRYRETTGDVTHQMVHMAFRDDSREHDFPKSQDSLFANRNSQKSLENCQREDIAAIQTKLKRVSASVPSTERPTLDPECEPGLSYVVPEGYLFAMGDNRLNSFDGRDWGPVPLDNVKGRALFVLFSRRDGPFWSSIRLERLGLPIR